MVTMDNADIQTARKILITEVGLTAIFIVLSEFFPGILYMLLSIILVSFIANITWSVRLLLRKPTGYIIYALLMLLIGVILPIIIAANAVKRITC